MFCCLGGRSNELNLQPVTATQPAPQHALQAEATKQLQDAAALPSSSFIKGVRSVGRISLGKPDAPHPGGGGGGAPAAGSANDALLQLLPVLTSLEGGWWDQLERAAVATAHHLTASHACVFYISGDASYASPLALAGPPAPPLVIGAPLPLPLPGTGADPHSQHHPPHHHAHHHSASAATVGPLATAASTPVASESGLRPAGAAAPLAPAASAPLAATGAAGAAAAATAAAGAAGAAPSCAAACLLAEQAERDPGRLLLFSDAGGGGGRGGGSGPGPLGAASPPEWRHLAGGPGVRHFAAVAIPAGSAPVGVLSLGAPGPSRPACWTPEALHSVAALLSGPLRAPQVDLASRALRELSEADTVHSLVRVVLGAAEQVVVGVTRIETQARVAFLQPDVEAAAVFQSAATDVVGPAMRRRLSEVLLVDTAAARSGAGGGGGGTGGGAVVSGGPALRGGGGGGAPVRRSLGGNEALPSRSPSVAASGVGGADRFYSFGASRGHNGGEELSVCRGHSLPLKHTLLSEALAQGTGLCIADCNAYVQDSKVYPRDLAVSRGAAPAQSLALATGHHEGRPLLALYATYPSILPQALLQTVVQELGQLLRALTPSVAAKVHGPLSVEWAHLRHQLLESLRNRSLRSFNGISTAAHSGHEGPHPHPHPHAPPPLQPAPSDSPAALSTGGTHAGTPLGPPSMLALASAASAAVGGSLPAPRGTMDGRSALGLGDAGSLATSLAASAYGLGQLDVGGGAGGGSGSIGLLGASGRGGGLGARDGRQSGRASFSLEAATSPRGSCKLAPLIATLHDRLKAAQAEQMANCRAASRLQDLESIRMLEQIGRGGYGVVYRGLYHGSEVAIKVIQEAEVAAVAGGSGSGGREGLKRMNSVALENKHLHDAIELVASVGMGGHPNIVQVLTFFTDVRVLVGERPADSLQRSLSQLDGVAELLRLTRMPSALEEQEQGGQGERRSGEDDSPRAGRPLPSDQAGEAAGHPHRGGGVIVLVQEFCDAGTLKTAINQRAFYERAPHPADVAAGDRGGRGHLQLNLRAVYSTLLEIALALRHMHGLHMVHCDLKPQNVLLKSSPRDPRGFTAKLSDFGLAKMMAHDEAGQLVIDEAVGSGTLTHMAPESLAGQKQLTASIDLFSFGILMWQMVCGTRLYQGLTTKQIIRGVVRDNLRPAFPAWVPGEYRRLAERCWHGSPPERPSAGAVVAELEAMVDATSRSSSWRAWRGGAGGGGGGLDSPRVRPQQHQAPPAHAHPPQQHQQQQQQSQHPPAATHQAVAQLQATQAQPGSPRRAAPSPAPHHHHPSYPLQQPQPPPQQQGPGRPQAGNTGAGTGPSLLII